MLGYVRLQNIDILSAHAQNIDIFIDKNIN